MRRFCTSTVILLALLGPQVNAQTRSAAEDELEEVVVTATLIAGRLNELAASATVLDGQQIAAGGAKHVGDVLSQVPNLGFAGGTSRPRYFQLRGIGELEQYEGAPNASVGFIIDDIDFSGIAMPAALFDLAQVEVLRGPQGSSYGANALAGLIKMQSRLPEPGRSLAGQLQWGNYGERSIGLTLNQGQQDGSGGLRLNLHQQRSDGFRRNAFLDRKDTNGFDEQFLRLRWQRKVAQGWSVLATGLLSDSDNGYDAWSIDNSRVTQSDRPGMDQQRSRALSLRLEKQGAQIDLQAVTSIARHDMRYSFDGDWGNDPLWGANGPYDFRETIARQRQVLTQDLRLIRASEGSSAGWVLGAYVQRLAEDYDLVDLYNGETYRALGSQYLAVNLAAYAQTDLALTPKLQLSVGGRIEGREARYRDSQSLRVGPDDQMWGGHLSLRWLWSERNSAYLALTRGYKAGGVNTGAVVPETLRLFGPESLWNVEAGIRSGHLDNRLRADLGLFHMQRRAQQVSSSYQFDPSDPLTFVLLTDNAARGSNQGAELKLEFQWTPQISVGAVASLLRAQFNDYVMSDRVLDGRDQPHAPRRQASAFVEWRSGQGFHARLDGNHVDSFFFSASHDERNRSYSLLNARVGYEVRQLSFEFWVRNLLDKSYAVRGFFFGNEPPDFEPRRYVQQGDPRHVGLTISFRH